MQNLYKSQELSKAKSLLYNHSIKFDMILSMRYFFIKCQHLTCDIYESSGQAFCQMAGIAVQNSSACITYNKRGVKMSSSKKMGLPMQMLIGMILGIFAGLIAQASSIDASWFKPLGQLFINLVRMVVVPLVFVTLVAGAASVAEISRLGRIAIRTLVFYFGTTAIAIAIGLVLANLIQPGVGLDLSTANLKAKDITPPALSKVLLDIVPINPIDGMAKGSMLQVIFFALILGFSLSLCGEKTKLLKTFFDEFSEAMIKVTNIVMYYAPIGVFGLMAFTVANHGLSVLLPLGKLLFVMYLACLLHILLVYLPCMKISGLTPGKFFKGISSPLLIAFTTCSSAAALSSNMVSVQKMGASRTVSSFSIPLGNTINMDGAAIYMGIVAIFAAEIYGIPMPVSTQLTVLFMALLASVGSMGVPGAAMVMITMVFTQVGIPLEAVALVAGIDRIMDMARTSINVLGDATAAIFVSHLEGELDQAKVANPEA